MYLWEEKVWEGKLSKPEKRRNVVLWIPRLYIGACRDWQAKVDLLFNLSVYTCLIKAGIYILVNQFQRKVRSVNNNLRLPSLFSFPFGYFKTITNRDSGETIVSRIERVCCCNITTSQPDSCNNLSSTLLYIYTYTLFIFAIIHNLCILLGRFFFILFFFLGANSSASLRRENYLYVGVIIITSYTFARNIYW